MKEDMYLRIKQVTARTGLSRATIYGMMVIGTFPMKTALGVRAVGWLASEIEQWMLERKTVEKVGAEKRPGGKRNRANAVSVDENAAPSGCVKVPSLFKQDASIKPMDELSGWENDTAQPSGEEMSAIRAKLRSNNSKKNVENGPVNRSSKSLVIRAVQPEPASLHQSMLASKVVVRRK